MKDRMKQTIRKILTPKYVKHLEQIPYGLCGCLTMAALFSLLFVYSHGGALLETTSPNERKTLSVDTELGSKMYLAAVPTALTTSDGVVFTEDMPIEAPFFNLIGREAGHNTGYLADRYQNQLLAEEIYSPQTGLWVKKVPDTQNIPLTLCADLQSSVYQLFADIGVNGTTYVYEYETGDILCCVSAPGCSSQAAAEKLPRGSLINKNLFALPPGSTMKVITLMLLAEQTDLNALSYTCTGTVEINGSTIRCHGVHGSVDMKKAIGMSCNAFFAQAISQHLDPKATAARLKDLGWNVNQSGPATMWVSGIPTTTSTISIFEQCWDFESLWSMMGETKVQVSPMYMCRLAASFACQTPANPRFRMDEETAFERTFAPTEQAKKFWKDGFDAYLHPRYDESLTLGKTGLYEIEDGTITATFLGVHEASGTAFFVTVENDSGGVARDQIVTNLVSLLNEE